MTRTREKWQEEFIEHLSIMPVVKRAAEAAGISRKTAYEARKDDPGFAEKWDNALEDGIDEAEAAACEWGVTGIKEKIFDVEGKEVGFRLKRSEKLLVRVLAAKRPKVWSEKVVNEHKGQVGLVDLMAAAPPPVDNHDDLED